MGFEATVHLAAVQRRVGMADQSAVIGMTRVFSAADRREIWAALTTPERLARWYAPVSGDLREGGGFVVTGNASGTILRCDPGRAITLTWNYGAQSSRVDLRLTDAPGGAALDLAHSFVPDETLQTYGPGALGVGWEWSLMELARHLGGAARRFDEERFAATDEGKLFVRGSADLWGRVAVLAGADPVEAAGAARRTAAFFIGE